MGISEQARQYIAMRWAKRDEPRLPREERRAAWTEEAAAVGVPTGTRIEELLLGGIASERVTHPQMDAGAGTFLLLHGGGYVSGNCITHRRMAANLSGVTGLEVFVPDYRLAPEHPFPAAVDDALLAYEALLARDVDPARLVVGGDSAGGGLSAALLLGLKERGLPMPRCTVLMSPWTDILARGRSYVDKRDVDPAIDPDDLREAGRDYTGQNDPDHPQISPIGADLSGLPPMLVQVGGDETMLDDSTGFAEKAAEAGVDVTLEVWPELWHVWQGEAPEVPEAVDALNVIGTYVRHKLAPESGA